MPTTDGKRADLTAAYFTKLKVFDTMIFNAEQALLSKDCEQESWRTTVANFRYGLANTIVRRTKLTREYEKQVAELTD